MNEYKFEWITEEHDICKWMDTEISRLERRFSHFEITWHTNHEKHFLEIWSRIHPGTYRDAKFGAPLVIGEVNEGNGARLPFIQSEGRKLYHKLKKDYLKLHRDLGGYGKWRIKY